MEKIWFQDPVHFITFQNYNKFFPSEDMNFVEQLNSLMRLTLYFCLVVLVIKHDPNIFLVLVFMGLFSLIIFSVDQKKIEIKQDFLDKNNLMEEKGPSEICIKPTKDNPFMNVLMNEYTENPNRVKACDVTTNSVNTNINQAFDDGLYRDVSDIFSKNSSDRQYVTNPSTTIPNDREKLTDWLYKIGPTCKDGNGEACFNLQYSPINI